MSNNAWLSVWIIFAVYFLVASAGAGHFTLSVLTMITGFMIARNYCGLLHEEQPND